MARGCGRRHLRLSASLRIWRVMNESSRRKAAVFLRPAAAAMLSKPDAVCKLCSSCSAAAIAAWWRARLALASSSFCCSPRSCLRIVRPTSTSTESSSTVSGADVISMSFGKLMLSEPT